jgi:5'-deoxynucleotidase YfbR-like HD superfamily hydrolase
MTNKFTETKLWSVKELTSKIESGKIKKLRCNRKKYWTVQPSKNRQHPSIKAFISFLYETKHSINAITMGTINDKIEAVDGNNRINAIVLFVNTPLEIFPEYLEELNNFIDDTTEITSIDDKDKIKNIFKNMSYSEVLNFRKLSKFMETIKEKDFYSTKLLTARINDKLEEYIETIQTKLKVNGEKDFTECVKIIVNVSEGYTLEELYKQYVDVNEHNKSMTETELLAGGLSDITNFTINDLAILIEIKLCLVDYYELKSKDEVLECHKFDMNETISAYEFIVGFQDYTNKLCKLIEKTDNKGTSLFFKLFKFFYKGQLRDEFTTNNVNEFINRIIRATKILNVILNDFTSDKLTGPSGPKLFESCNKTIYNLEKNNVYIIIISILGFFKTQPETDDKIILNSIKKCILYHLFVHEIKNKITREEYQLHDAILYQHGGKAIENMAEKVYASPTSISNKVTEECMRNVLQVLISQNNECDDRFLPNGSKKKNKRRDRRFHEKMLMYYFYKQKVPSNLLNNNFWLEHICPFSSNWQNQLCVERLGNVVPIIDYLNHKRLDKHISTYEKCDDQKFIKFINDIIPHYNCYDKIISHKSNTPEIIDNAEYEKFCEKNEAVYINNFITCLYPK